MIEVIIKFLNQKLLADSAFKKVKLYTLATIIKKTKEESETSFPAQYDSNDEMLDVSNFDSFKGLGYHRLIGSVTSSQEDSEISGCEDSVTKTYPMRLVFSCRKDYFNKKNDNAFIDTKIAETLENVMVTSGNKLLNQTLTSELATISPVSYNVDRYEVWGDEYENIDMKVHFDRVLLSIDYEVSITATQTCFLDFDCSKITIPKFF